MKEQKSLIEKGNWDNLIVLDACRFDFFKDLYRDYLDGRLWRVISEGSQTSEWLRKTFGGGYFDAVYVSANPYVNSQGVDLGGINGCKHFKRIIDAWKTHWDKERRTILPASIGKLTRLSRAKYPDKKIISHFMQPHSPYLSLETVDDDSFSKAVKRARGKKENKNSESRKFNNFKTKLEQCLFNIFGWKNTQRLKGLLNLSNQLSSTKPAEKVAENHGDKKLRLAYKRNLETVLSEVSKLSKRLPGEVVVTSDHGELLGEDGLYSHYRAFDHPLLKEVPWLKVT